MSDNFEVTMPGQPPSWNHMYRWTTKTINGKVIRIQVLTDEANLYKSQLSMVARAARPSDFRPQNQVIVAYFMFLGRELDDDNVMKATNDSLAIAIGVNDKKFRSMTMLKEHGHKDPHIVIRLYDADHWYAAVFHA